LGHKIAVSAPPLDLCFTFPQRCHTVCEGIRP
jgi:hypothetical protein